MLSAASAQQRLTPKEAKGGEKQGEAWASVPESFRRMNIPEWPLPTNLKRWEETDRPKARETLMRLLGEMPARPDPKAVRVVSREDRGEYTLERFEFHNGVDMMVPGILLVPKNRRGPVPAIIGLHGHGSSKESICTDANGSQFIGPLLAKQGYVVA
ncbi:MAG TPA: alpha/beta hydrolase family protein, partial [Pirellulaceae bacterium]|nr:alpha/beta hydrolase family protein [Pirellulaceae bacterium]